MTKIKLLEEKDCLDQQIMCAGKIFAISCVTEYVPKYLPWYECDGLMRYIDHKELISDPDAAIKNTKVNNFEMIHTQCRGISCTHSDQFYQTVREKNVAKMPQNDRKKNCHCLFEI